MKKVLLVYATRYGATEKVAKELSGILEDRHVKVRLFDLKGGKDWPSPENYDGTIVASSVAKFNITKEASNYVKKYSKILEEKLFGFIFCSGASIHDEEKAKVKYVKLSVKPDVFRGVGAHFDFTPENRKKVGFFTMKMVEGIAKSFAQGESMKLDFSGHNDLLKHDRIMDFAHEFYTKL